ncbi:unnamed protein product [Heterobilharzia americana]|nr:unnamed protein product [Heterobilharzia americana]
MHSNVFNNNSTLINDDNNCIDQINNQNCLNWYGGACPSFLIPGSSIPYALEEPHGNPSIILSVQDNISEVYNLNELGVIKTLHYNNFVYLTLFGPLTDSFPEKIITDSLDRRNSTLPDLVFDVLPDSNYVVCAMKSTRRHSQLWKLAENGLIYHEGAFSKHKAEFVLDVNRKGDPNARSNERHIPNELLDAETIEHFEVVQLHGLLVNSALFCVQMHRDLIDKLSSSTTLLGDDNVIDENYNDTTTSLSHIPSNQLILLAARPRPSATRLISASITSAIILPIWLRPGSGKLRVFTYLDKTTRVLRIEDDDNKNITTHSPKVETISPWRRRTSVSLTDAYSQCVTPLYEGDLNQPNLHNVADFQLVTNFKANVTLPIGIGISVISSFNEELIYASVINFNLSLTHTYTSMLNNNNTSILDEYSTLMMTHVNNLTNCSYHTDISNDHQYFCTPSCNCGLNSVDLSIYHPYQSLSTSSSSYINEFNEVDNFDNKYNEYKHLSHVKKESSIIKTLETLNLCIGHFQIDSQFAGALLPVLLFQVNTRLLTNDEKIETNENTHHQSQGDYRSDELKHLSKLKIMYCRDVQNELPVYLFKIFRIDINPVNIQIEELLLLKLIQFYQHAFEEIYELNIYSEDSYNNNDISYRNNISDKRLKAISCNDETESKLFWFDQFFISPIKMKLSVQTAKTSLTDSHLEGAKRLLPSLMSFTGAEIQLDLVERLYVLETIPQMINYLDTYYRLQFRAHALNIFGSVDFLGNPIGLINDLSSGISGLVELDVGGLIRHVAHGVGDSAAKVAGSVSQLLNAMSLDDKHQQERAVILGSRAETSSLLHSSHSIYPTNCNEKELSLNYSSNNNNDNDNNNNNNMDESLDDFELTCRDIYLNMQPKMLKSDTILSPSPPLPPPPHHHHHRQHYYINKTRKKFNRHSIQIGLLQHH